MSTILFGIALTFVGAYILANFVSSFGLIWITRDHTAYLERLSARVTALEKTVAELDMWVTELEQQVQELSELCRQLDSDSNLNDY